MERYDLKLILARTFEFNTVLPSMSHLSLHKCWNPAFILILAKWSEAFSRNKEAMEKRVVIRPSSANFLYFCI